MGSTVGVPPSSHPVAVAVAGARGLIGAACEGAVWSTSDQELTQLIGGVEGLRAQADALMLAVVREVDGRDLARRIGATGTGSWLSGAAARLHPGAASAAVRLARDLDQDLTSTHEALQAGGISMAHAQVIARTMRELPKEAGGQTRADAQAKLLELAERFNPADLAKAGRTILAVVDPDLADRVLSKKLAAEEAKLARGRELTLTPDPLHAGLHHLRGKLDAETAEMLLQAIEPFAVPRPTDADGPDTRTRSQRLGDGLNGLLTRYLSTGDLPVHGRNRPQVVVRVTDHNLHTGTPVSIETIRRITCDAQITYLWSTYQPGDLTTADRARTFDGRLRRLLELRDGGCAFPGCGRPPSWCHAHHIKPWHQEGPTVLANGVLLCGHHHRLIHRGEWTIRMGDDQLPEFIPPEWIDPNQNPLRNTRLLT